ncbi:hypothetical protein ACHAWO_010551 [Cyclotella atomus]|jgi:hypothetical protein|uniref:Uncharacterized protein n=1 Tax=Cyclotella atomus TaxID=382360 RepID=A0ABD3NII2_9STRA
MWMRTGLFGSSKCDGYFSIKHLVVSLFAALVAGSDEPKARSLEDGIPSCPEGLTNLWILTDDLTLFWDVKYGDTAKSDVLRVCSVKRLAWFWCESSRRHGRFSSDYWTTRQDTVLKYNLGGKRVEGKSNIDEYQYQAERQHYCHVLREDFHS